MAWTPERRREWERNTKRERRDAWFAGKSCVQCGSTENLEVDHIDPTAKESGHFWSWSQERREAELAKCQPLCNRCHIEKHRKLRAFDHGTRAFYNRGCRCEPCREAKNKEMRAARRKKNPTGRRGPIPKPAETYCGTPYGYSSGCRCRPCRDAVAAAMRERRRRRRASAPPHPA